MAKHYPAILRAQQFHCVHCGVYAAQHWHRLMWRPRMMGGWTEHEFWSVCTCSHCGHSSYWYKDKMVVPAASTAPAPHEDFPEDPRNDYDEARAIFSQSPRAAVALLRLCLQKLLKEVGQKGENINADIAALVKVGLPDYVQKSLDYCRVIGNNAVHPGEINLDDTPEMGVVLFDMLNLIVEQLIAQPKRIASYYESLPEGARAAIEKRDARATEAMPADAAGPAK